MSIGLVDHRQRSTPRRGAYVSRRARRAERRRLARRDIVAAQLAELRGIRDLLEDAITVVSSGWVQHAWFAVTGQDDQRRSVTAHDIPAMAGRPVSAACLVGSIVHAAGGPPAVHTQLVQRTLDLTWHALHCDERQPVRWCPSPEIRTAHVRDLTRWNDCDERTADQVAALLRSAVRTAHTHTERLREHQPAAP